MPNEQTTEETNCVRGKPQEALSCSKGQLSLQLHVNRDMTQIVSFING